MVFPFSVFPHVSINVQYPRSKIISKELPFNGINLLKIKEKNDGLFKQEPVRMEKRTTRMERVLIVVH